MPADAMERQYGANLTFSCVPVSRGGLPQPVLEGPSTNVVSEFGRDLVKVLNWAPANCRERNVGNTLRKAGQSFHRLVARSEIASQMYFSIIPHVSRRLWPAVQQRLRNSINSVAWPNIALRPRSVTLGNHTEVLLCPHLQEFDME